eukprot:g8662.t1
MAASSSSTRHAWYANWQVHRRLRPEAYRCLVHKTVAGHLKTPLPKAFFENKELLSLVRKNSKDNNYNSEETFLLPMAVSEGSPTHPAYASGHAINVGALCTTLKAFHGLELGKRCYLEPPVMANEDDTKCMPYEPSKKDVCDENGNEARGLTRASSTRWCRT